MSEVNGNFNSANAGRPVQPTVQTMPNVGAQPSQGQVVAPRTESVKPSSTSLQFNSATGPKSSQKVDLFAEQNTKRAETDEKRKKNKKIITIVCSIIGGIIVIGSVAWIIIALQDGASNIPEDTPTVIFSQDNVTEDMNKLQNLAFESYKPTAETSPDGETLISGTLDSAEQVFDKAQSMPQNKDYVSQINVSKIIFYVNNGFYNLAIENINNVNIDDLDPAQRVAFYNFIAMAYYNTDNKDLSSEYTKLAKEEAMQLGGVGE